MTFPTQIELIKKYQLSVRGHLGQHLLMDPNVQRNIVKSLQVKSGDHVLEIGPGLGALSHLLLDQGAKLLVIEKDSKFVEILKSELQNRYPKSLTIVCSDVLKVSIADVLTKHGFEDKSVKVLSNMPYYITAPILFDLIEHRNYFSRAVLTMQKEVADRLFAKPGTKEYSRLTLGVGYSTQVTKEFDISKHCFSPKPKVASTTVSLDFTKPRETRSAEEERALFHLIRIAFGQRRKTLSRILLHDSTWDIDRSEINTIFEQKGWDSNVRGETLTLEDYLYLSSKLFRYQR